MGNRIATGGTPAACPRAGGQTAPAVSATTVPFNNPFPYAVMVNVVGGTGVTVQLDGFSYAGNNGPGWYRIEQAGNITLTYTGAPTWDWTAAQQGVKGVPTVPS